jgi:hypothetical protein
VPAPFTSCQRIRSTFWRVRFGVVVLLAVVPLTACGGSKASFRAPARPDPAVRVPADRPAAPSSWPAYPRYSTSSCWVRRIAGTGMIRSAPSRPVPARVKRRPVASVVSRELAQLGDRRYVRRVVLAAVPKHARQNVKGYFAGVEPPADARWGYVSVRGSSMLATWEGQLVAGALRDRLCANGGPPLVAWRTGGSDGGFSDATFPFEQRFPNPTAAAYRQRVQLAARRYGFRVVTLRLLHPLQTAPLLIVATARPRQQFIADVPAILADLNPGNDQATTFEGFYFEARDRDGPFVRTDSIDRGQIEGGQWSADPNDDPFPRGLSPPNGKGRPASGQTSIEAKATLLSGHTRRSRERRRQHNTGKSASTFGNRVSRRQPALSNPNQTTPLQGGIEFRE